MSQEYRTRTQTDVSVRAAYGYNDRGPNYGYGSPDPAMVDHVTIANYDSFNIDTGSGTTQPTHQQTETVTVIKGGSGTITGSSNPSVFNIFNLEGGVTVSDGASADTINIANVQNGVRINHGGGGDLVRVSNAGSLTIADTPKPITRTWSQQLYDALLGNNERPPTNTYVIEHVDTLTIEGSDNNDRYVLNYDFGNNNERLDARIDGKGGANVIEINAPSSYFERPWYDTRVQAYVMRGQHGEYLEMKNITAIRFTDKPYPLSHEPVLLQRADREIGSGSINLPPIPTADQRFVVVDAQTGDFNITNDPRLYANGRQQHVIDTFNGTSQPTRAY